MDENLSGQGMLLTPELLKDLTAAMSKQGWKPEELQLKQEEVRNARRSVWTGMTTAIASAAAVVVAAVAASFAAKAVTVAQIAITNQTKEARFSTGLQALGGNQSAERVAGAIILRRNVEDRLASAQDEQDHNDAFNLYLTTENILEDYLKAPVEPPSSSISSGQPIVIGGGQNRNAALAAPKDEDRPGSAHSASEHVYVALQLAKLLSKENQDLLHRFNNTRSVSVDLSNAHLAGQYWPRIDFSWLDGKFFYGIDLRTADLTNSRWGDAELNAASLQCANLEGSKFNIDEAGKLLPSNLQRAKLEHANLQKADLRFTDLRGADLTGAYIDGALFDGAQLTGAKTDGVIGTSDGGGVILRGKPDGEKFDVEKCIENRWDQ